MRRLIIAPDRDKSGVSNCLTLDRPLQLMKLEDARYAVDGTPTDCVHLGTSGIFMKEPERVISGINFGANLGDIFVRNDPAQCGGNEQVDIELQ